MHAAIKEGQLGSAKMILQRTAWKQSFDSIQCPAPKTTPNRVNSVCSGPTSATSTRLDQLQVAFLLWRNASLHRVAHPHRQGDGARPEGGCCWIHCSPVLVHRHLFGPGLARLEEPKGRQNEARPRLLVATSSHFFLIILSPLKYVHVV